MSGEIEEIEGETGPEVETRHPCEDRVLKALGKVGVAGVPCEIPVLGTQAHAKVSCHTSREEIDHDSYLQGPFNTSTKTSKGQWPESLGTKKQEQKTGNPRAAASPPTHKMDGGLSLEGTLKDKILLTLKDLGVGVPYRSFICLLHELKTPDLYLHQHTQYPNGNIVCQSLG